MSRLAVNRQTDVTLAPASDAELLDSFVTNRDETAFRELVVRHGPLVLAVCRRTLDDEHTAEDAFQATFLALALNAATIRRRGTLASWLYSVAFRTANRVRKKHRRRREQPLDEMNAIADDTLAEVALEHRRRLLDEELDRLPAAYREPLVLHYLLGKSRRDVAKELGLSVVVVKGRLQRGRQALRMRLALRGVGLSVALAAVESSFTGAQAAASPALVSSTVAVGMTGSVGSGFVNGSLEQIANITGREMFPMNAFVVTTALLCLLFSFAGNADRPRETSRQVEPLVAASHVEADANEDETTGIGDIAFVSFAAAGDGNQSATSVKYHDDKPDGRKSLGGSGEMIRFTLPTGKEKVRGVRVHGSRYGYPQPPKEDVLIYVMDEDMNEVLLTETAPYSRFKRGDAKWVALTFKKPVELPKTFWVVLDFKAGRTKGVYVSYDTSSEGKYSKIGLPGKEASDVKFGGDWMIELLLERDK